MKHRLTLNRKRKRAPNPLRLDPSRTASLRRAFAAALRKRFARLRLKVWRLVAVEDAFGLGLSKNPVMGLSTNQRWRFATNPGKLAAFQQWLRSQIQGEVLSDKDLLRRYVEAGFKKGAGRAFDDVRKPERVKPGSPLGFYAGTREEFLRSAFARPVAVEKVELLASRVYTDLEGVTEAMATQMTRTLTDGLVRGASPREVARDLAEDVDDIGRDRAVMIARSELIRSHAEGQLQALEDLGVEDVGVAVEWLATEDDRLCPKCADMQGVVLKLSEAHGLLPRHPNCRCTWIPSVEVTDGEKRSKRDVTRAIEESLGGEEDSDWAGVDVEISTDRPRSILNYSPALLDFSRWLVNERTGGGEFFARCARDEKGYCLPESGGLVASPKEWARAKKLAVEKGKAAPVPTEEEVQSANARMDEVGADRYEADIRGKSSDRAASRKKLLEEFGDGKTCPCVYCSRKLDDSTVTRDKIYTARQGGRYRHSNLVPACLSCNKSRGDIPWSKIRWK